MTAEGAQRRRLLGQLDAAPTKGVLSAETESKEEVVTSTNGREDGGLATGVATRNVGARLRQLETRLGLEVRDGAGEGVPVLKEPAARRGALEDETTLVPRTQAILKNITQANDAQRRT